MPLLPRAEAEPKHGFPGEGSAESPLARGGGTSHWLVSSIRDGGFEALYLEAPDGSRLVRLPSGLGLALPPLEAGGLLAVKIAVVRFASWDEDRLESLEHDLL